MDFNSNVTQWLRERGDDMLFANIGMFMMAPIFDKELLYKKALWTLTLMLLKAGEMICYLHVLKCL